MHNYLIHIHAIWYLSNLPMVSMLLASSKDVSSDREHLILSPSLYFDNLKKSSFSFLTVHSAFIGGTYSHSSSLMPQIILNPVRNF